MEIIHASLIPTPDRPLPVRRIRESLLDLPEESGMRGYGHPRGFARWLGRSESLIRNVECGCTPLSANLARRIEEKTGVSAAWLMSAAAADGPIMAADGGEWVAAERLDPYAGASLDFRPLLATSPRTLPGLIGRLVEAKLRLDLDNGSTDSLTRALALLRELGPLTGPEIEQRLRETLAADPSAAAIMDAWTFAKLASQIRSNGRPPATPGKR